MLGDASCIMGIPPLWSTVRVNTLQVSMEEAKERMNQLLTKQYPTRRRQDGSTPTVLIHPRIPDCLVISGSGPHVVTSVEREIYVDKDCGCAVMRGADIYVPGVLGSNGYFCAGDIVSVYMDLEGQCKRGLKRQYSGKRTFLGNGVSMFSRNEVFSSSIADGNPVNGIGIMMAEPVWDNPRLDSATIDNWGFVQNLPSIVCGHVVDPQPGEVVLDMCAAPGGKSTHLATLMKDQGTVICIDSSQNRIKGLCENAHNLSLNCIQAHRMNANDLLKDSMTFPVETFDRILLDAPCSCTGQRPYVKTLTDKQKRSHVPLQRKLLTTACAQLKRGGTMVYSTCSLEPEENENQIVWFLKKHTDMQLAPQKIILGQEVSVIEGSPFAVQKFNPMNFCAKCETTNSHTKDPSVNSKPYVELNYDQDTIGFFIAKMVKR